MQRVVTVETSAGRLRGEVEPSGARVFRGIPYGEPTGGDARFRAPTPQRPWTGVREARRFGPNSHPTLSRRDLRFLSENALWSEYAAAAAPRSEDCLRLNVWAPAEGGGHPVLVWLHGGGFSFGSGSSVLTHGDVLAADHDLVVVTVNHRLGILGHLHLEDTAGEGERDAANAGILDLRLALRWVAENIAAFGGDPGNVTIVGHSGGGAKVAALLALPSASGLFQRAVIQSGVVSLRAMDRDEAAEVTSDVGATWDLDMSDVDLLRSIPARTLTAMGGGRRFRPVVSGELLPQHPFDPDAAPSMRDKPLLIGTTTHDTATFKFDSDPDYWRLDERGLVRRLAVHPSGALGARAEEVMREYRAARPDLSPAELLVAITSDRLRQRTDLLAQRKIAGGGAPLYFYEFAFEVPMPDCTPFAGIPMSQHGLEIPFMFGIADRLALTGESEHRRRLAEVMSSYWAAFAREGVPSAASLPEWPAYSLPRRPVMRFDETVEVVEDPDRRSRTLFEEGSRPGGR